MSFENGKVKEETDFSYTNKFNNKELRLKQTGRGMSARGNARDRFMLRVTSRGLRGTDRRSL